MSNINLHNLKTIEDCGGMIKKVMTDDEIIKLAKAGQIPHYVLNNPATNENLLVFSTSEINNWFENNCIKRIDGFYNPDYKFIYFDKKKYLVDDKPKELRKIKEVYSIPIEPFSVPSVIYFLYYKGEIVYIGQSKDGLGTRITSHVNNAKKKFDKAFFIPVPDSFRLKLEAALIRLYKPIYNTNNASEKVELTTNELILLNDYIL